MSELDPLLLRALAAGRGDRPASDRGRMRTMAALGLAAPAISASEAAEPPPSGVRLGGTLRGLLAWPWWTVLAFVVSGRDGQSAQALQDGRDSFAAAPSAVATVSPSPVDVSPAAEPHVSERRVASAPDQTDLAPMDERFRDGTTVAASSRAVNPKTDAPRPVSRAQSLPRAPNAPPGPSLSGAPGGPVVEADARREKSGTASNTKPTSGPPSLREEIEALEPASRSLAERRCGDAKRALAAYRTAFPNGRLEREAEVLEIEILGRSGASERARAAATRFVARFPGSPYVLRLAPWLSSSDGTSNVAPSCVDVEP